MMENIDKASSSKDKDIQWVTLSQNSSGDWSPSGPFKSFEVRQKMEAGLLKPTDYCWQSGWSDWKRIFDEPSFYHSRKPPIEIPTVKKESSIEYDFKDYETLSARSEVATKIQVGNVKQKKLTKNNSMLEPWETPATKATNSLNEEELSKLNAEVPSELSSESLKTLQSDREETKATKTPLWKTKKAIIGGFLVLVLALVLDLVYQGQIYQMLIPAEPNLSVSYIMVEDYNALHPRHLISRTDLKKGNELTIRLLDINEKPIKTIKGGDGLKIPSKGTGQIRIPLYPYNLSQGSYKILVKAGEAEVLKTFTIPAGAQVLNAVKKDSSKSLKDK